MNLPSFNISITDYISSDATYTASGSTPTGNVLTAQGQSIAITNNADGTFVIDSLIAGDTIELNISLTIDSGYTGSTLRNWAEISSADDDRDIGNTPPTDIDSTPDGTNFNQAGETDDVNDDNVVNEDGKNGGDEDDHDPAEVSIITVLYDWGDLPDSSATTNTADYQTTAVNNGPRHGIISGLSLGAAIDEETDGAPSNDALGDGIDEDGFDYFSHIRHSTRAHF